MGISSLRTAIPGFGAQKCRHCGSEDVRPSTRGRLGARYAVYRCRACRQHFKVACKRVCSLPALISALVVLVVLLGVYASFHWETTEDGDTPIGLTSSTALAGGGHTP